MIETASSGRRRRIKLVYASLGTVFNDQEEAFVSIIGSFALLHEPHTYQALVAVGALSYAKLEARVANGQLFLPDNVLVVASAPQLDVLRRASLFITHCGMNSTSEAIAYGVPLVAIPVKADQPRVARRAIDEMRLGVRLELSELSAPRVAHAIETVIGKHANDCSYQRRVLEACAVSRKHNGSLNAACEIVNYISSRTQTN